MRCCSARFRNFREGNRLRRPCCMVSRTLTLIMGDMPMLTSKGKLCLEDVPNSGKLPWPGCSTV